MNSGTLPVTGANLYYEERGRGPLFLLMAGGTDDAGVFEPLATVLAADYRVVSYDPRGNSRSALSGPPVDQRIEEHADDALRILEHLAARGEPVRVFASCSGAHTALQIMARHPQRIYALVIHEPPTFRLLSDAGEILSFIDAVHAVFQHQGKAAALEEFSALFGGRPSPYLPAGQDNAEFFLAHLLRPSSRFLPDLDAVAPAAHRIAVAGGRESRTYTVGRPATALAAHFRQQLVEFPGGHGGYIKWPHDFAAILRSVLTTLPRTC